MICAPRVWNAVNFSVSVGRAFSNYQESYVKGGWQPTYRNKSLVLNQGDLKVSLSRSGSGFYRSRSKQVTGT